MPVFIIFSFTASFLERCLLAFPPLENGSSCGESHQECHNPYCILFNFSFLSMLFPISSLRCALAIEAREMSMLLLGPVVLQSQVGFWSISFNVRILVHFPVSCLHCFSHSFGTQIPNSCWLARFKPFEFCFSNGSDVVIPVPGSPVPLLKMKATCSFYFESTLKAEEFKLSITKQPKPDFCSFDFSLWNPFADWSISLLHGRAQSSCLLTHWAPEVSSPGFTIPRGFCPLLIKETTPNMQPLVLYVSPPGKSYQQTCVRRCDVRAVTKTGKPR